MAAATRWISAAAAFGFMIAAVGASADMVLIRGAKVFDGLKTIGQRDVLLDQGRIKLMSKHIRSTAKMQVIEGGGKMLMPGLMDGHVHTFPGSQKDALRFGITTVFDMYSLADKDTIARWRRQRSTYEAVDEADTFTAGIGATPPGGHPTELFKEMPADMPPPPTLADNASAKAFMAARVDAGSDYIKILQDDGARPGRPASLPAFSPARFSDVIGAAKATGKRVVVHVQKLRDARIAVANGADALAHAICDAPLDREIIRSIVAKDVAQTATLDVYDGVGGSEDAQTLVKDPAIAPYLSDSQKGMLSLIWPRPRPDDYAMALANTAALAKAGAVFIAGTDAPNPTTAFGPSLHLELELLVRAGLTPTQALIAATSAPAKFFGTADRGRIAPGLRADLIMIEGDATRDISATRRIVAIWKNGVLVNRSPTKVAVNARDQY